MLGINTPKVLAKGEYARAVRKAAIASQKASEKKNSATQHTDSPYKFEWKV